MKKLPVPPKKKRPSDANMRMASIIQDVVSLSNKQIVAPQVKKPRKKR
jgi:hypothetical protein